MATRPEILNEAEFNERWEHMTQEQRDTFTKFHLYQNSVRFERIEKNCNMCNPDRKQQAFNITGLAGLLLALGAFLRGFIGR